MNLCNLRAVYEFCGKASPKEDVTVKTYEEYDKMMNKTMKDIDSDSVWIERKKHLENASLKAKPLGLKVNLLISNTFSPGFEGIFTKH